MGRHSEMLARSGLCSVVSNVGGMVSMLVMWLIAFVMFMFILTSGIFCWVRDIVV